MNLEIANSVSLDWLKPLVGTIVGFFLGLVPSWFRRIKDQKDVGKVFDQQLESFKISIQQQVQSIDEFVIAIQKNEFKVVFILQESRFELFKSISPLMVIKHLERKKINDASNYLSNVNYNIDLVVNVCRKVEEASIQFDAESVKFIKEYKAHYDSLTRLVAREVNSAENRDQLIVKFIEIVDKYIGNKPFEINLLLAIRKTFNEELFKFPFDLPRHRLHESFAKFNYAAVDLVMHYEVLRNQHINRMKLYSDSLKTIYNELYKSK